MAGKVELWNSIPEKDENLEAYLNAMGVDMSHPDMRKEQPVTLHTFKQDDEYHHKIGVKEAGYVNDVAFRLGKETPGSYNGHRSSSTTSNKTVLWSVPSSIQLITK